MIKVTSTANMLGMLSVYFLSNKYCHEQCFQHNCPGTQRSRKAMGDSSAWLSHVYCTAWLSHVYCTARLSHVHLLALDWTLAPTGGGQEDDSGELSVNSCISTSLIFTVYRMWQPHFSVLSRLLQKQLLFSSLTFSIQVCNLWMKNLTSYISQLLLHWCYVKTTLNLSIAHNRKHLCSWICQSVEIWLIRAELDRIPHCWSCWGLFCITGLRISDHRNARSREHETASQTVWWLSKNLAHTVSSTRIFLVRASHTWPGSRSRRRGSKCCLHEWEKLPSYRAWMKFLSFLSNQL